MWCTVATCSHVLFQNRVSKTSGESIFWEETNQVSWVVCGSQDQYHAARTSLNVHDKADRVIKKLLLLGSGRQENQHCLNN